MFDTNNWNRGDFIRFYRETWGTAVVPVSTGKKPLIKWGGLTHGQNTAAELCSCESSWGLALVMGHPDSQCLFSLDIDSARLFMELQQKGAFPEGACIARSQSGHYHVVMRATAPPKTVPQHSIPGYDQLRVCGTGSLAILPPTPGRQWLALHEQPATVDLEQWLQEQLGYHEVKSMGQLLSGQEIALPCLFHEDHNPSMSVNVAKGVFYCHGCGEKGTVTKLVAQARIKGVELPQEIQTPAVPHQPSSCETGLPQHGLTLEQLEAEVHREGAIAEIIPGVLARDMVMVLFAPSGQGKSIIAENLVVALCCGQPIWGLYHIQRAFRVLVFDTELSKYQALDRFRSLFERYCEAMPGAGRPACGGMANFEIIPLANAGGRSILDQQMRDYVAARVSEFRPDVVLFDNLSGMHRVPENDNALMRQVFNNIRETTCALNAAAIVVHHSGHQYELEGGGYKPIRERGASSIRDCSDVAISITGYKGEKNIRRLTFEKKRDVRATGLESFLLEYDPGDLTVTSWAEAETDQRNALLLSTALGWLLRKHSQREVANLLKVDHRTVGRWAAGTRTPDPDTIQRVFEIAKAEGFYTVPQPGPTPGPTRPHPSREVAPLAAPERGGHEGEVDSWHTENTYIHTVGLLGDDPPATNKAQSAGEPPGRVDNPPTPRLDDPPRNTTRSERKAQMEACKLAPKQCLRQMIEQPRQNLLMHEPPGKSIDEAQERTRLADMLITDWFQHGMTDQTWLRRFAQALLHDWHEVVLPSPIADPGKDLTAGRLAREIRGGLLWARWEKANDHRMPFLRQLRETIDTIEAEEAAAAAELCCATKACSTR